LLFLTFSLKPSVVFSAEGLVFENGQKAIEGFSFKDIKPGWSQSYSVMINNPMDAKAFVNLLLKNPNDTSLLKYFTIMVNNNELSLETLSQRSLSLGDLGSKEIKNYELLFKAQNLIEDLQGKTLTFDLELVGLRVGQEGVGELDGKEGQERESLTEPSVLGTSSSFYASTSGSDSANMVDRSPILMAVGILIVFAFIGGVAASLKKS